MQIKGDFILRISDLRRFMENIKENLDNRICDCLENATNTETYREFIINGWKELGCDLSEKEINDLSNKTNEELNDIVDELDWLLSK